MSSKKYFPWSDDSVLEIDPILLPYGRSGARWSEIATKIGRSPTEGQLCADKFREVYLAKVKEDKENSRQSGITETYGPLEDFIE